MAEVDASIPLQAGNLRTQVDFPELLRLRIQQGLAQRQQQALDLEQAKQMRSLADEDQLRGLVSQGGSPDDIYNRLIGAGRLPEAMGFQKNQTEHGNALLGQQAKVGDLLKNAAGTVLADPNEQNAINVLNKLEQITGHSMDSEKAQVYSFRGDPNSIRRWAAAYSDPSKLFPKVETKDLGGSLQTQQIDPLTGQTTLVSSQEKTPTPDSLERNALTREGHQIQIRGQNLTDSRERDKLLQTQGGKAPPGYRFTESGNLEAIPGGPADQKLNMAVTGKESVDELTSTLRDYYDQLKDDGGITNVEKGAMSNIGAQAATSGVGQSVGRALGTKNQSIRDSISQTRPLLLQAIKNATGMSAKQMDSNVELKLYLAAATDPSMGYQTNVRALDKLNELYGIGSAGAKPKAESGKPVKQTTFNSMPDPSQYSGKRIKADDGVIYKSNGSSWVRQ